MSSEVTLDPANPLAPSELILLNGEEFADNSSGGERVNLINLDGAVKADQLGEMMLAAAFLANEQAGGIRLESRQQSSLGGYFGEVTKLDVAPGDRDVEWPAHSVESAVYQLVTEGAKNVRDVVDTLIARDSQHHWKRRPAQVAFDGMATRNLLDAMELAGRERRLWGKSGYILPDSTANMAAQQKIG